MIDSAMKQRDRVSAFVSVVPELEADKLTNSDWADLEEVMELLEPFKYLTMLGQQRGTLFGSIGSILWGFDMLLTVLEKARKKSRPADTPFQAALDYAWGLLDKYYKETDKSGVHVVSLVLDPHMKYNYFERNWPKKWMEGVRQKMTSLFDQYWESEDFVAPIVDSTAKKAFDINKWRFGDIKKREDEFTRYLKAPLLVLATQEENDTFDLLEWWRGNAKEYPMLARIGFAIYSIPAMSVESERVFSG
jgi:hypothetical protein